MELGAISCVQCTSQSAWCVLEMEEASHMEGKRRRKEEMHCQMHLFKASFIFFLLSQLPATGKHVGDVLVLKAMAHSFIQLFHVISQFALDIPETIDNCDRKLQGKLTYNSLLALFC